MTTTPDEAAARLDRWLERERLKRGMLWRDVVNKAAEGGYKLSTETLRAVRRGETVPRKLTKAAIEYVFECAPGSVDDVMEGRDPTPMPARVGRPLSADEYDDPALQAIWEIDLLPEDERRAAIMAVEVIRDQKRRAQGARRVSG